MPRTTASLLAASALLLFGATSAQADFVYTFSDLSSDEGESMGDATPASVLDARLGFSVASGGASSGNDLLNLTLYNDTSSPDEYAINEVYFNFEPVFDGSVSGSALSIENGGGTLTVGRSNDSNKADGFGTYDVFLDPASSIASGNSNAWGIDLGTTGTSDSDFQILSTVPPGSDRAFSVLKFVEGPDGDSAFGAVVPVPAAVWLFGSGLLALAGAARRSRKN